LLNTTSQCVSDCWFDLCCTELQSASCSCWRYQPLLLSVAVLFLARQHRRSRQNCGRRPSRSMHFKLCCCQTRPCAIAVCAVSCVRLNSGDLTSHHQHSHRPQSLAWLCDAGQNQEAQQSRRHSQSVITAEIATQGKQVNSGTILHQHHS